MFLVVHLINHLAGLASVEAHLGFMAVARMVYRHPLVEPLLLAAFALQGVSGLVLAWRGRRCRALTARLQMASGAYLALFLLIHVGAILHGREILGLDTNLHFAAAGIQAGLGWLFLPYYGLAVLAAFTHFGSALEARARRRGPGMPWRLLLLSTLGGVLALILGLLLAGRVYPLSIPDAYLQPWSPPAR